MKPLLLILFATFFCVQLNECQSQNDLTDAWRKDRSEQLGRIGKYIPVLSSLKKENIPGYLEDTYDAYYDILSKSSCEDLTWFLQFGNNITRCYIVDLILKGTDDSLIVETMLSVVRDEDKIVVYQYSSYSTDFLGNFFLEEIFERNRYKTYPRWSLIEEKKAFLDSVIMYRTNTQFDYRSKLLDSTSLENLTYSQILNNGRSGDILSKIVLARFRRKHDIPIILSILEEDDEHFANTSFFKAIIYYPDSAFLDKLIQLYYGFCTNEASPYERMLLFQALVQYQNPHVARIFLEIAENADPQLQHTQAFLWLALQKYPTLYYRGIAEKMNIPESRKKTLWNLYH